MNYQTPCYGTYSINCPNGDLDDFYNDCGEIVEKYYSQKWNLEYAKNLCQRLLPFFLIL